MNGWILFFVCGLIDYIARKTKNKRTDIVNWLGKDRLQKIYDLADVYHCDNIDRVCEDFIEEAEHLKETNPDAYENEYMGKANGYLLIGILQKYTNV